MPNMGKINTRVGLLQVVQEIVSSYNQLAEITEKQSGDENTPCKCEHLEEDYISKESMENFLGVVYNETGKRYTMKYSEKMKRYYFE